MIKYKKQNSTAILTLNRPEKRNALSPELVKQLCETLEDAKEDKEVKSLIITGQGAAFCAGADLEYLNKLSEFSTTQNLNDTSLFAKMFLDLYKFPKPTIAAVNGPAIAGGCGLASVCDFIVADENNAKFGYSEVKIGFIPAMVSLFLMKRVGESIAKQLLISAEIIEAKRAYEVGFVNYLSDNSVQKSLELASSLEKNSAFSMMLTKKMIRDIQGMNVEEAVKYCLHLNVISRSSEDFKQGLNNFLNK